MYEKAEFLIMLGLVGFNFFFVFSDLNMALMAAGGAPDEMLFCTICFWVYLCGGLYISWPEPEGMGDPNPPLKFCKGAFVIGSEQGLDLLCLNDKPILFN